MRYLPGRTGAPIILAMAKRPSKGDIATLRADVVRVWENGNVTLHIRGYDYPITLHERHLVTVEPKPKPPAPPKEPKRKGRGKPFYDEPT